MDSRKATSGDHNRHPPLPDCVSKGFKPSRSLAAVAKTRCSKKCATASEAPRSGEAQHRAWADLPSDILGIVVSRLPLVEDRARLRSICRAWRAAARLHRRPPLPLLVLSDFSFASFCAEGTLTGVRRRVPLPDRETGAAGSVRCVGSFEGWLVAVKLNKGRYFGDLRCFLMNAFSQDVVRLPPPSAPIHSGDAYSRSLPVINGSGVVKCAFNTAHCVMSFSKVVLSSSPDSGSKCVVVAISVVKSEAKLALWRSGMKSWCVCDGGCITEFIDIIFCQEKLYMLSVSESTGNLLAFEISDDDDCLMVSRVECREIEQPVGMDAYCEMWSIVEWRGKLLIVVTYSCDAEFWQQITDVRVFEADLSTNPIRLIEIESLDGDFICLSTCSSKSFRSCDYDVVEGDLIYFIDGCIYPDRFVYNMKDGTMAPVAADIPEDKFWAPNGKLMNPTWLFPPE